MAYENNVSNSSISEPGVNTKGVQYERDPDVAYGDHIKDTCAICNTSASHTYGNVLSVVEKYLLDIFPQGLFKTVTASTTLASRQVKHLPSQLVKLGWPIMVLVPRVVFGQDDRFLGNTLINSRTNNTASYWGDGSLLELGKDIKRNMYVEGHYNRSLMHIDAVLSFDTYSEQVNWLSYLHNMVPVGHNQFIRAPLELYLPEGMCELISKSSGVPIQDENGSVSDFLTLMNGMFYYPITYKLKGGSNSNEFFMYYVTDVDTTISNIEAGSGVKNGQVRDSYDISFTVRCEFNTIGYFMFHAPSIKKNVVVNTGTEDMAIVPMFSDVINLDDFHLPLGWTLLSWPIFKLKPGESSISLEPILNQSLNAVIDHHIRFGIPMERFIDIQFRENGVILNHELFYIDWSKRMLHIIKPDVHRTYRLIVSVSPDYINNLVKQLYDLE